MFSRSFTKPPVPLRDRGRLRSLAGSGLVAALCLLCRTLAAQDLPVQVGDSYDSAVAALRKKAIAFQEKKSPPTGAPTQVAINYEKGDDRVALDFSLWPDSPTAPARAYEPAGAPGVPRHLTLTHVRVVGHNSEAAHRWRQSMRRDPAKNWVYLPARANPRTGDAKLYPTAGYLQWTRLHPDPKRGSVPWVTFLFQAQRPKGTEPRQESTILDIFLENPYSPRTF
jgi:hypothetical protein